MRSASRGFTLIEVLAAAAIAAIGIVSGLSALSAIGKAEVTTRAKETLTQLTIEKYDEILATQDLTQTSFSGDFTDHNDTDHTWIANIQTTGTTNLSYLTVTVKSNSDTNATNTFTGLVYVSTTAGTTAAAGTTGGGTGGGTGGTAGRTTG